MKNKKISYFILAILFVIVSIVVILIPIKNDVSFWITYCFTIVAFIVQIFNLNGTILKKSSAKEKFLGIPQIYISFLYLIFQIIALFVFKFIYAKIWVSIIVNILILGIAVIYILHSIMAKNHISSLNNKVKTKTMFIKTLKINLELLYKTENNEKIKEELTKLIEKVRFSDPMSCDEIEEIEKEIIEKVEQLKSSQEKANLINNIDSLLEKRNKLVKLNKD